MKLSARLLLVLVAYIAVCSFVKADDGDLCKSLCNYDCESDLTYCDIDEYNRTCECKLKAGALAGILVGSILLITLAVIACCFCCPGCPIYRRRHPLPPVVYTPPVQTPYVLLPTQVGYAPPQAYPQGYAPPPQQHQQPYYYPQQGNTYSQPQDHSESAKQI